MRTKRRFVILVCCAVALLVGAWFSFVRQTSLESIRASLREKTPVGTRPAEVYGFIQKRGWRLLSEQDFPGSGGFYGRPSTNSVAFGGTCIAADIGHYRLGHESREVMAFWGFGPSNRLVVADVW